MKGFITFPHVYFRKLRGFTVLHGVLCYYQQLFVAHYQVKYANKYFEIITTIRSATRGFVDVLVFPIYL